MDNDLAERLIPLEGGVNFRDMGGYATEDGRRVKWRRLYRSGTMTRLTSADYEHLAERNIRTVIDLRTTTEQTTEPNHWCSQAGITYWCRDHDETFGQLQEMVDKGIASPAEAEQIMEDGYRSLPFRQAEAYAELFRRIAAGATPIVFNCTAGKDRTGGAAALVLAALGVSRDTVIADFTMTERAVDLRKAFRTGRDDPRRERYLRLAEGVSEALRGARPSYIAAMLETLEERCGSVEEYLREVGVTDPELDAVREELLE